MIDRVKFFESRYDFHKFVEKQSIKEIGEGAEGNVYLNRNNEAIKEFFSERGQVLNDNIIMQGDIPVNSFIFPEELYVCNKLIIGYKSKYFYNIFRDFDGDINDIDLDALIKAGYIMLEDIKVMSELKYVLYDLPYNLLFDGTELKAIDTLAYCKKEKDTFDANMELFRTAILSAVKFHDGFISAYDEEKYTRALKKEFGDSE